ncbi:hypothetical protein SBOR_6341 [Sclerotinia borealis F-4128]|uniref:2EXR domain-containing protein n=1 Tax=Sclerotinia borealis (strain F-4128) TaxID=1432307 RepID=W9CBY3_SCLBF|nr:hypothetical protein SBOR_6341 [Sclerotinia borealis F-4128]
MESLGASFSRRAQQVGEVEQGNKTIDTSTERESQDRTNARSYLDVSPVEGRISVGSEMAAQTILDGEVMAETDVHHSVAQFHPVPGHSTKKDLVSSGQKDIEETCYSPDMLDFFETQLLPSIAFGLDFTVPATSFTLFPYLPVELQRKIWFFALPPPEFVRAHFKIKKCDDGPRVEFSIACVKSPINNPASSSPFGLQSVCYMAREIFLEHYRRLKPIVDDDRKILDFSDWDYSFQEVTVTRGPGPWFDMAFDTLYLVHMYGLWHNLKKYKVALNFTTLRTLAVDEEDLKWIGEIEKKPGISFESMESLMPSLERLLIILNTNYFNGYQLHRAPGDAPADTQLRDYNQIFEELKHCQWMESCGNANRLSKWEDWYSSEVCEKFSQNAARNSDYWKRIDVKLVWIVYIVPYYIESYSGDHIMGPFMVVELPQFILHLRCDADGTLPDQYDGISELFDEGEQGIHKEEVLINMSNDQPESVSSGSGGVFYCGKEG